MQFPILSIVIIAGILMTFVFILYILKYRPAKNYKILILLTSGCLLYLISQLFEYISTGFITKVIWNHGTSIGIVIIILSFFIFSIEYAGKNQWLTTKKIIFISLVPIIWLAIDLTNELHDLSLLYGLVDIEGIIYLTKEYHAISWIFFVYSYVLIAISYGLFINIALSALSYYRKRVIFILFLSTLPIVANFLHMTGILFAYFDPTPISVTFSILLFLFGVTRYNIGEMVPTTNKVLMDSIRDGVIVLDDLDRIIDINPIARKIIGHPKIIGEDIKIFWPKYHDYLEKSHFYEKELDVTTEGIRQIFDVGISECLGHKGNIITRVVSLRNITERKQIEERLKYLSFHDKMTGLYNRAFFEEEILRIDSGRQLPVSLIMGDADGLKFVNDTFGYAEGDRLLKRISSNLLNSCREEDIIARWGGDEFAVLLTNTDEEKVRSIVDRIEKSCASTTGNYIPTIISLGAATKTDMSSSLKDIMKLAEDRMKRRKMLKAESRYRVITESLMNYLHEKNHETREHLDRMEKLSRKFGARIGLTSSQIEDISLIAVLHDIGKIAISDRMLSKKSSLTVGELDQMKKHSEIGYRIALSFPQITSIAESILHHHEWWDGNGYPAGLQKKKIPLLSRIISIIDAYDVMLNGSPYKKPVEENNVLEELTRCSGTQFDPNLVKDFIKIINDKRDLQISGLSSSRPE